MEFARNGAVCAPHHLASQSGSRILKIGGSAVDAAIAASAVLCVIYPHMVTLGGDSWTLIGSSNDNIEAVDGTGRAPVKLSASLLRAEGYAAMPQRGPHAVTVPGGVSAWGLMHSRYGRLPFSELLVDAIKLAEQGVQIAPSLARDIAEYKELILADAGCTRLFLSESNEPKTIADRLVQPALAASLRALSDRGVQELYGGKVAERYVSGLNKLGSLIALEDLLGDHAELVEPLTTQYGGATVFTSPPNSQGFVLLQLLSVASRLGNAWMSGEGVGVMPRVVYDFGKERDRYLGDVNRMPIPVLSLLNERHIEFVLEHGVGDSELISRPNLTGDTAAIVSMDEEGLAVSMVQSVAGAFGSGLLEESTGILAQNRGSGFSLDGGAVPVLTGGDKPPHSLMPVLVARDGSIIATVGTMGGKNQPAILAQVISRVLQGEFAQNAVDAPRWVVPVTEATQVPVILVDPTMPQRTVRILEESGFSAELAQKFDGRLGHTQLIIKTMNGFDCGTDSRADGNLAHL